MRVYHGDTDIDLPASIQSSLDSAGVLWRWASEDSSSKREYDIATDSVTISTVHSVKGLMMYVAITRARTRLYVPYV